MELLPGIIDDITLDHITTKLPWRTFHILSSVSRRWRQAIQSRLVYDAKVRAHSAQIIFVHNHRYGDHIGVRKHLRDVIALYSKSENRCFELPPIPGIGEGIPWSCQCISLDGKIYVLGGEHWTDDDAVVAKAEVYVLDLAGQRQWEECPRMEEARMIFGSGVVDGKIYVFGGADGGTGGTNFPIYPVCGCEVYDPKVNAWSPISPMPSWRQGHNVAAVGEELYVCGGDLYDPDYLETVATDPDSWGSHVRYANSLEVYNTVKDKWTVFNCPDMGDIPLFMSKGNLHRVSKLGIDVYDKGTNSWSKLFAHSFAGIGPVDSNMGPLLLRPEAFLAVNDEIFGRVHWGGREDRLLQSKEFYGAYLLQSKVFANENKEIEWQKTNCSFEFDDRDPSVMSAIQL